MGQRLRASRLELAKVMAERGCITPDEIELGRAWAKFVAWDPILALSNWHPIRGHLEKLLGNEKFQKWIVPASPVDVRNGVLYLRVPCKEFLDIPIGDSMCMEEAIAASKLAIKVVCVLRPEDIP